MKQDYPKVQRAGAELVMLSPDSREAHDAYAAAQFGEPLPYLYVADPDEVIARRYGLLRETEHHHGGFWHRSLWIVGRDGRVAHLSLPWTANSDLDEYLRLFALIGAEPGAWIGTCKLPDPEDAALQGEAHAS